MRGSLSLLGSALVVVILAACDATSAHRPANDISMEVTEAGFVPAVAIVKKGEPVTLTVTRKTDKTCATEIVIHDYGIRKELPLNQPVTLTFTPRAAGPIHFSCAMNMVGGVLTAQ
jgi:plastocyanin domain-containing protein